MANYAYVTHLSLKITVADYTNTMKNNLRVKELGYALQRYIDTVNSEPIAFDIISDSYEMTSHGNYVEFEGSATGRWNYKSNLEGYFGHAKAAWEWLGGGHMTDDYENPNKRPNGWYEYLKLMDLMHRYNGVIEVDYKEIDEGGGFYDHVVGNIFPPDHKDNLVDFDYFDLVPTTDDAIEYWGAENEDEAKDLIQEYCDRMKGKDDDD